MTIRDLPPVNPMTDVGARGEPDPEYVYSGTPPVVE